MGEKLAKLCGYPLWMTSKKAVWDQSFVVMEMIGEGSGCKILRGQSINIFHSRELDQNVVGKREAIKTVS